MKKSLFAIATMVLCFGFIANATGGDEIVLKHLNKSEITTIAEDYNNLNTIDAASIVMIDEVKFLRIIGADHNGEAVEILAEFSECGECQKWVQVPGGWQLVDGLKAGSNCFECSNWDDEPTPWEP